MQARLDLERLETREQPSRGFLTLPVLPFSNAGVLDNARAIVTRGQQLGRNTDFVLKLGDSNSSTGGLAPETFLSPLGSTTYNPDTSGLSANYGALVSTWSAYHSGPDSLFHEGPGAYPGWTSANVLAGYRSEVAATNAGIALIMIGTNDMHTGVPLHTYKAHLRQLVRGLTTLGVLPVLSTIPDTHLDGGSFHSSDLQFNQAVADVAHEFRLPLWNVYIAFNSLPNQGLLADGVHLTTSPNGGGSLWPTDMSYAQNVRNLEALKILRWFRETVVAGGPIQVAPHQGWLMLPATKNLYAVGRDRGVTPTVDVYNAKTGRLVDRFLAFRDSFGGGVRVASGDVNGDGYTDIVCATGSGTAGTVRVFSGKDGSILGSVRPFGKSYVGGSNVAAGDLDGDGTAEVVIGSGAGTGVRVYTGGDLTLTTSFQAFQGSRFHGVDVAVANVAGAGPEIAVAATNAGGVVRQFAPDGSLVAVRHPYGGSVSFGLTVTAVDLNGDGSDELAVAPTSEVKPVRILDPNGHGAQALLASFGPDPSFDGGSGVRLGSLRSPSGYDTLLVGNGPGVGVKVEGFNGRGRSVMLPPHQDKHAYGIFIG